MDQSETQNLAERIAFLLRKTKLEPDDLLRSELGKINERLDRIETNSAFQNQSCEIQNLKPNHPSRQIFVIPEDAASDTDGEREPEKICPYEPAGKPCDYCSMCSSLGF